jgi:hypothetical protein
MTTALLLSIHTNDIVGAIFTVVWLLLLVIVSLVDYGFKHGWFIPSDETVGKYRERVKERAKTCP